MISNSFIKCQLPFLCRTNAHNTITIISRILFLDKVELHRLLNFIKYFAAYVSNGITYLITANGVIRFLYPSFSLVSKEWLLRLPNQGSTDCGISAALMEHWTEHWKSDHHKAADQSILRGWLAIFYSFWVHEHALTSAYTSCEIYIGQRVVKYTQ